MIVGDNVGTCLRGVGVDCEMCLDSFREGV